MKLASFHADGLNRIGFSLDCQRIVDLSHAWQRAGMQEAERPRTLLELIEGGPNAWAALRRAAASAGAGDETPYSVEDVTWLPPVLKPSKICCIALNNSANADRIMSGPKHPAMFVKPASALIGHKANIVCKSHYGRTHPEPELAVVIGRTATT